MRVACPNCTAEYEVPDALLATGPRRLRCARCSHMFDAGAPTAVTRGPTPGLAPGPAPGIAPGPVTGLAPAPEPSRESRAAPSPPPPLEVPPEPGLPPSQHLNDPDRPPPTRGLRRHSPINAPADLPEAEDEPSHGRAVVALAWLLSLAVLVVAGWAVVGFRAEISEAWPPMARLYGALGLD
jgi:predicted Zn finger-like uncharacterized protein